ncbi:GntG family PLP-dependent aldolase [Micromonospora sp. WMMD1082]|uniref:GntG family PLP-dependent aldolase n=1 Tax=Micromonospora sp. WMMD1082 TaxID=3016104 RepID=UPI0024165C4F|nr:GntG family PLP-dependent aldolase [Micromonospora sp. WMMD1082]MDG4797035.1 GntG family PLP-dependent aldolase [Micromonospora sp. WMMD1082]
MRSDTFTLPTPQMLAAMTSATLGDDVYGEDPTVRELEETSADLTGKQAACFLPSGTMANLCAILAQVPRGAKVVVGDESDIYLYEAAGASVCAGASYEPVVTDEDGRLPLDRLAAAFPDDPDDPQFALPALICLENTHNRAGGVVLDEAYLAAVRNLADERGVPVHLDGARLFNAALAAGTTAEDVARHADTVQFCLSKGLCAPVGSMLAGPADVITRARRARKLLGGGMRQAGVLAAAGLVAVTRMPQRLVEDHANALRLADGLAQLPGVTIDPKRVRTNIVLFRLTDLPWQRFVAETAHLGLRVAEFGHGRIRAVTHRGVSRADVDRAVEIVARVVSR